MKKNINLELEELKSEISNAIKEGDADAFAELQISFANNVQDKVIEMAKNYALTANTAIGSRLTHEEREYYNEVITLGGFDEMDKTIPATVYERVFTDLRKEHALLDEIDFLNTTGLTEITYRDETKDGQTAVWGALTSAITKKLEAGFKVIKTGLFSLTAYIPVHQNMLALGPEWLDRYVVELLKESIALALETAVVAGTGKEQPIGMIADLEGSVVSGVYPAKAGTELTTLSPTALGKSIMAPLTKEGKRAVTNVLMVVNPIDYWEKIFPATTFLTADKSYIHGVLPIPAKIVQSAAVPKGKMIAGLAKDYVLTVGSEQKIQYSDEYKFLEDQRIYKTKLLANGQPKDNASFLVFNITNLAPTV